MDEHSTSARKIEANRKNAMKSTGPRTAEGKARSRWNAVRHGILAKSLLIEGKEDRKEFSRILQEVRRDRKPVGILEELLVEKISVYYWREGRAIRAEVGEITGGNSHPPEDPAKNEAQLFPKLFRLAKKREKAQEIEDKWEFLMRIYSAIHDDTVSDALCKKWTELFGDYQLISDNQMQNLKFKELKEEAKKTENWEKFKAYRAEVLRIMGLLGKEVEETKKAIFAAYSEAELDAATEDPAERKSRAKTQALIRSLPSPEASEKIIRYEGAIERMLYRAIEELDRLQARRKKEAGAMDGNGNGEKGEFCETNPN